MALVVTIDFQRHFSPAQIHVDARRILETAYISHVVGVVMGKHDGIDFLEPDKTLKAGKGSRPTIKKYCCFMSAKKITGRGFAWAGVGPPVANDGKGRCFHAAPPSR